jgi:predicted amidophosphoribosyltransferase
VPELPRDAAAVRPRPGGVRFDSQARRLLLPFKHADRTENTRVLVPHMARAGAALLRQADVLVPVPLHRRRLFLCRYTWAARLAHGLARTHASRSCPTH